VQNAAVRGRHARVPGRLAARVPLPAGTGQTRSRWLGLSGHQTRYDDPAAQNEAVQATLDHLAICSIGARSFCRVASVPSHSARTAIEPRCRFHARPHIFSWAIPNAGWSTTPFSTTFKVMFRDSSGTG
jgi:hypothetical protein